MNLANTAISIVSNNTEVDPYLLMDDDDFKYRLVNHIKSNHELSDITLDLINYVNSNY